jgi:hypothetical protein
MMHIYHILFYFKNYVEINPCENLSIMENLDNNISNFLSLSSEIAGYQEEIASLKSKILCRERYMEGFRKRVKEEIIAEEINICKAVDYKFR